MRALRSCPVLSARWLPIPAVALAVLTHAILPPGWLQIVLAVVAFALVARDRRYGVIGAATLLLLALPYDRAASNGLLRIGSVPIRPHDAITALALAASLPGLLHVRRSGTTIVLATFLAVGVGALVLGLVLGNAPRDILRDARWWFLYGAGLLALGLPAVRTRVVRGLLIGATVFAVVAAIVTILPAFEDGLKYRALIYDEPALRMQFGNSVFLIPAALFVAWRWFRYRTWSNASWLLLLFAGLALSLTRVLMVLTLGCLVIALAWWTGRARADVRLAASTLGLAVVGLVIGVVINLMHPLVGPLVGIEPPVDSGGGLFDRLTFQGTTGLEAIGTGRFETYAEAISEIRKSPVVGLGLGALVDVDFQFGGVESTTGARSPNVDNAYLTVGLKAGAVGIVALGAVLLLPLTAWRRRRRDRLTRWLLPAWLGVLGLTMTQSFATNGYSPFTLSLIVVILGGFGYASSNRARAVDQR